MNESPESHESFDSLETNLYQIAEKICMDPPQAPNSIQLVLDHDTEQEDIVFEILSTFTLACMELLFGQGATPCDLNEKDFKLLNSYINSVGYELKVKKEETETAYRFNITFEPYGIQVSKQNPYAHLKKYM